MIEAIDAHVRAGDIDHACRVIPGPNDSQDASKRSDCRSS
jgi:hypothetical protein